MRTVSIAMCGALLAAGSFLAVVTSGWALALPFVVPLAVVGRALRSATGRVVVDTGWAAGDAAAEVVAPPPARGVAVAWALARVEARALLADVVLGTGATFGFLIVVLCGWSSLRPVWSWGELALVASWFALLPVGMVVLASFEATNRPANDGTDELFASCPAPPSVRTAGLLATAPVPVALVAATVGLTFLGLAVRGPDVHGRFTTASAHDLAAALALGAGGVALGVAVGRWVPFGPAPVAALVAVGVVSLQLDGIGAGGLSVVPMVEGPAPVFTDRRSAWHLAWVLALTALVAVLAMARHRRDRVVGFAAAVAVVAAVAAGIGVTRPLDPGRAARLADVIRRPEAHQACVPTAGPVQVCGFDGEQVVVDQAVVRIDPIARALPAALGPLVVRQVYDRGLADLPPEVRALLTEADLRRPQDEVPLGHRVETNVATDVGFRLAVAAVGLPPRVGADLLPTVVAGEARGVVALWLAARGMAAGYARWATRPALPTACSVPLLAWSAQDRRAADAVLDLPAADVEAVLHREWSRWTDPATGTDELLAALGVDPLGPFDRVVAEPGRPC